MNRAAGILLGLAGVAATGGVIAWIVGRRNGGALGGTATRVPPNLVAPLYRMQSSVAAGVQDPRMRKLALGITRRCPPRDGECEAQAVYDWASEHDADPATTATLLALNGITPEFVFTGDDELTDAFAVARLPKEVPSRRVPLARRFGQWPVGRRVVFPA